jgi:hypothetical protein
MQRRKEKAHETTENEGKTKDSQTTTAVARAHNGRE